MSKDFREFCAKVRWFDPYDYTNRETDFSVWDIDIVEWGGLKR